MNNEYHKFCRDQISRLAGLQKWPDVDQFPQAISELIHTLEHRVGKGSEEIARAVIDQVMGNARFCPAPADLIQIGCELRDQQRGSKQPRFGFPGCAECSFSGWRRIVKGEYEFAEPCGCRRGLASAENGKAAEGNSSTKEARNV